MSCNCKETRKVKSCPTVSVEETILTELRNLYDFLVAKFLALFALPALTTPTYEWRVVSDGSVAHGGETAEFDYDGGDTQYRFNFTLPAGVVFLSTGDVAGLMPTTGGVWYPGNVCPAPDTINFGTRSGTLGNFLTVTAPGGGEIPPGLYTLATTNGSYNPIVTYLVRV